MKEMYIGVWGIKSFDLLGNGESPLCINNIGKQITWLALSKLPF